MPETITKPDNMEYYEQISALFSEMETIRKEKLKKLIFIEAGFSFMFLITLFANISLWKTKAIYSMSVHVSTALGIISLVCLVLGVFFASKENQDFIKQLKCVCLGKIIKAFGKISYIETFPFSNSTLAESNLFSMFNNIFPGDMFKGNHDGVTYKIAETQLRDITGSGKNTDFRYFPSDAHTRRKFTCIRFAFDGKRSVASSAGTSPGVANTGRETVISDSDSG